MLKKKLILLLSLCLSMLICTNSVSGEALFGNVYHEHDNTEMKIALTFDDGPHPKLTPRILEVLKKYQIHATFFIVGENADRYPELIGRILADGHEIGNHTYTHGNVIKSDYYQMKKEFKLCEKAIYEISDYKTKLLRPPEGFLDSKIKAISKEMDYNVILWNIDTKDWAHNSPRSIYRVVTDNISPGSIILMHDYISHNSPTVQALELFIPALLKKNYQFVVVSDLIGSN